MGPSLHILSWGRWSRKWLRMLAVMGIFPYFHSKVELMLVHNDELSQVGGTQLKLP